MTGPIPVLADARPAPLLRVAEPTLAATMPTAMLLVDYALAWKAMPTPELQTLSERLPADLVDASWPVRAALAHGAVLRSVLLHQLPPDHPGHTDWSKLRRWLAAWPDDFMLGVIDWGIDSVMHYQQGPRDPEPTAAKITPLAKPSRAMRRDAPHVLKAWAVPDPKERAPELLDPVAFRSTLLDLLDAIWDGWLERAWTESLDSLRAAVAATPAPPPGCSGTQWISLVTGLRPDEQYAAAAEAATDLVVMPSPGLGRSLSLFTDRTTWVLFTPHREPPVPERTGISVGRLAELAPTMHALGDRTRLAIALHLLENGPLTAQQLADALEVHQSTISRQVTALRRAGVVAVQSDRRITVDRAAIRQTCQTLLAALD
ncbi:MAG TPA: winged helix-turn-helix domain-containing protein [Mycobacteriales bacterium]|nr:winged helix-turn-helix domain-containing protein [Mycobacteriales bacterium]